MTKEKKIANYDYRKVYSYLLPKLKQNYPDIPWLFMDSNIMSVISTVYKRGYVRGMNNKDFIEEI